MRHHHTTQVFTPFGSGYVPEDHGAAHALGFERTTPSGAKWVAVIAGLLIGATTTAGALTAHRSHPPIPKLWHQPAPFLLMNLPDVVRLQQSLF
jgi:hypothetical protein